MCCLELVPLGGEENSSHAHKAGSWYLLGDLFKIFDEHPHRFYVGVTLGISDHRSYVRSLVKQL